MMDNFIAGLLAFVCRMKRSYFNSDVTAFLVGGGILAVISEVGILLEFYRNKGESNENSCTENK